MWGDPALALPGGHVKTFQSSAILWAACMVSTQGFAQTVSDPRASFLDVPARQSVLASTTDKLLLGAMKSLKTCTGQAFVAPPVGRIDIPHHYLHGSNGPTDPLEAAATRVYAAFERRVTAGMNQYVASRSHTEAACALDQLDAWATASALLDYDRKESSQAWYQVEWTAGSAGVSLSALVSDPELDAQQRHRVTDWLLHVVQKNIAFEKPNEAHNNHHYWKALAAAAIGVTASNDVLFRYAVEAYKEAIGELDAQGAWPLEMARHENALNYQSFALEPLVMVAQFASRQGVDLYSFASHGRSLKDAVVFLGSAAEDHEKLKIYTTDEQTPLSTANLAFLPFYVARFGSAGLPGLLVQALAKSQQSDRIGGNTTVLASRPN